jgi:hypothetical protein
MKYFAASQAGRTILLLAIVAAQCLTLRGDNASSRPGGTRAPRSSAKTAAESKVAAVRSETVIVSGSLSGTITLR